MRVTKNNPWPLVVGVVLLMGVLVGIAQLPLAEMFPEIAGETYRPRVAQRSTEVRAASPRGQEAARVHQERIEDPAAERAVASEQEREINQRFAEQRERRLQAEERQATNEVREQQFFWELVEAQDRAQAEADRRYPIRAGATRATIEANANLSGELSERYEAALLKRYGYDARARARIVTKGVRKNWPMPAPK